MKSSPGNVTIKYRSPPPAPRTRVVKHEITRYGHTNRHTAQRPALSSTSVVIINNLKGDPLEMQHPKFENSRLGFIHESVHVMRYNGRCDIPHGANAAITRKCSYKAIIHNMLLRLWYLSQRRPAKTQASLRILAVSPGPSLFGHMMYGDRRKA